MKNKSPQEKQIMPGPLKGIRVVDLSRIVVGPYCTMVLGDMGAEIIKIEIPKIGDETRMWGPPFVNGESAYYISLNRNKKSVTLDLKTEKGKNILLKLIEQSDVLVENFRLGTLKKFGLDWLSLREVNPRLIYCSITGYGKTGPCRHEAGVDLIVSGEAGLIGITGEKDRPPSKVGVAITDIITALFAQGAIANALYYREKTGKGQNIDLSLFESQVATLFNMASSYLIGGQIPERWGLSHASIVPYQGFKTKDEEYILVAVTSEAMWKKFCQVIEAPDMVNDPRFDENRKRVSNRGELVPKLDELIASKLSGEWIQKFKEFGIPCGMVNDMERVFSHPQIKSRDMIEEISHPTGGEIKLVGIPVKYSESPGSIRLHPPLLGEHTDVILSELLGLSNEEIDSLRKEEVV